METFKSSPSTIGALVSAKDVYYQVPLYQRTYSWSEDNIDELFDDIELGDSGFFGTIMLNVQRFEKEKTKDIVDGQQRITTVTIIFAVLRDILKEFSREELSNKIHSEYISNKDDDLKDNFKLNVGEDVLDFFKIKIQGVGGAKNLNTENVKKLKDEEKRIVLNYLYIKKKIENRLSSFSVEEEKINYLSIIREEIKKLKIVVIEVGSEEDAFVFFETLNARGLDLTQSDLIKNYLFKNIDQDNKEIKKQWKEVADNLSFDNSPDITEFIRHYWQSINKQRTTVKKLFSAIKKEINTSEKTKDFLEVLVSESVFYRAIAYPSDGDWQKRQLGIYEILKRISDLGVTQSRPLLLSCVRVMKNDEEFWNKAYSKKIEELMLLIENFTIRFTTISGKSPAPLDRIFSNYAFKINEIYRGGDPDYFKKNIGALLNDLRLELIKIAPEKNTFLESFLSFEYKRSKKRISQIGVLFHKIFVGNANEIKFTSANIEHVLPQKPQEWGLTELDVKDYVNKMGNLLPLGSEYNREASNMILKKKKNMYEKSKILAVREFLTEVEKDKYLWNENTIYARTKRIAEMAWEETNLN